MKKCFKCGKNKKISEFYKHPRMADGHLNKCIDCTKKDGKLKNGIHKRGCKVCKKIFNTTGGEISRGGGKFCSRECWYKWNIGENAGTWKDEKSYSGIHKWIKTKLGTPKYCEHCKSTNKKVYHWSNISGKYLTDVADWQRLCVKCHSRFDNDKIKPFIIKCVECGKEVETKSKVRKYCSKLCSTRHYRKTH